MESTHDFPVSLPDRCRLGAENDRAVVLLAAQLALDDSVG
jgi:hypothetical protein